MSDKGKVASIDIHKKVLMVVVGSREALQPGSQGAEARHFLFRLRAFARASWRARIGAGAEPLKNNPKLVTAKGDVKWFAQEHPAPADQLPGHLQTPGRAAN